MITEVFFPRELKQTILELKHKNNLNNIAYNTISRQPILFLALWFVFSIVVVVAGGVEGLVISIVMFLLILLLQPIALRHTYRKQMASYIIGQKKSAVVVDVYYIQPTLPGKCLKVHCHDDNTIVKVGPYTQWTNRKHRGPKGPSKGDPIEIFVSNDCRYRSVPNNYEIKSLFCLSKSIVEGADR